MPTYGGAGHVLGNEVVYVEEAQGRLNTRGRRLRGKRHRGQDQNEHHVDEVGRPAVIEGSLRCEHVETVCKNGGWRRPARPFLCASDPAMTGKQMIHARLKYGSHSREGGNGKAIKLETWRGHKPLDINPKVFASPFPPKGTYAIAAMVPTGMDVEGCLRSPLMLAPAMIPVVVAKIRPTSPKKFSPCT